MKNTQLTAREFFTLNIGGLTVMSDDNEEKAFAIVKVAYKLKMLPEEAASIYRASVESCLAAAKNRDFMILGKDSQFMSYFNKFMNELNK